MRAADAALAAAAEEGAATGDGTRMFAAMLPIVYSQAFLAAHGDELALRKESFSRLPQEFFAGGRAILQAIDGMDLRPVLGAIGCPTLVLAAEHDALMPVERTRAVAAAIPGARFELVRESGHALVVEKQQEFLHLVAAFLAQARGKAC